jgi:hypothetical protein
MEAWFLVDEFKVEATGSLTGLGSVTVTVVPT